VKRRRRIKIAWICLALGAVGAVALVGAVLVQLRQPNLGVRASTERPLWVIYVGLAVSLAMPELSAPI